jgi:hypothetical protein
VQYHSVIDEMLSSRPKEFKYLFRMTSSEFTHMVINYKDDAAFEVKGKSTPAEAKYQLSVFIYRLAHGHEMQTVQRLFGIFSEYLIYASLTNSVGTVNRWTNNSMIAIIRGLKDEIRWPTRIEKDDIHRRIKAQFGIPHCLGFIDGTHINLERKLLRGKPAGSWHSRKSAMG